jgi:asparagine synthase (glutamine-hydrolysing)
VEASLLLPDRLKIAGREQKIALRRAMVGIVPQAVLDRRDKVAFQAPQRRWLLDPAFEARFQGRRRAESTGLLATGTIPRLFDLCRRGRVSDTLLWRAICVELWLDALGHD